MMSGMGIGFGMILVMGLLALVPLVLAGVALVSIYSGSRPIEQKLLWTVVVLLAPFLGALLYFVVGRKPAGA